MTRFLFSCTKGQFSSPLNYLVCPLSFIKEWLAKYSIGTFITYRCFQQQKNLRYIPTRTLTHNGMTNCKGVNMMDISTSQIYIRHRYREKEWRRGDEKSGQGKAFGECDWLHSTVNHPSTSTHPHPLHPSVTDPLLNALKFTTTTNATNHWHFPHSWTRTKQYMTDISLAALLACLPVTLYLWQ